MELRRLTRDLERLRGELEQRHDLVIGRTPAMQEVYKVIGRVAPTDATVLIQGETGTGKELIAKSIHQHSSRGGPFMALNCSAIPNELLESELFGYERGAFTGAVERRIGKFEAAAGGTLFLDEIADMPLALQTKLLRVLQEREFTRVGGREAIRADVRIIAATNQDLEAAVRAGRFREDLYFRLNVVRITVPPLRERRADVPELIEFFLGKVNRELGTALVGVSAEVRDLLLRHSWPGNVRELENALLRAAVLTGGRTLVPEDFALAGQPRQPAGDALPLEEAVRRRLAELLAADATALPSDLHALLISAVERPLIEVVLERAGGARAAEAEGVHLGQDDLPVAAARRVLGAGRLIGVSTHDPGQARAAEAAGADYLGVGPVYATATKPDALAPRGLALVSAVRAAVRCPLVAIGGITPETAAAVRAAGADAVAMIGALVRAPDPEAAVRDVLARLSAA